MKTLILCIDRDNDFGEKTEVTTPLMGREDNLRAAQILGLTDPEDSDMNSVFAAVQLHDQYVAEGREVEVATVCGDINVGTKSDRALTLEVESVLEIAKPDSVVLVSDGAEDEFIYPIVASRVKVDHVKRVYVKQNANMESNIHIILNTLKENKFRRKVYVPMAMVTIVLGLFGVFGYWTQGLAAIFVTLGFYLFIQAFNMQDSVSALYKDMQSGIVTGRISVLFTSVAIVLTLAAVIFGLIELDNAIAAGETIFYQLIAMFMAMIWWFVFAAMVFSLGKAFESYIKERRFGWTVFTLMLSIIAMGFVFTGSLQLVRFILYYYDTGQLLMDALLTVFVNIVLGISIAIVSTYIHRYIKEHLIGEAVSEPEWQQ